MCNAQFKLVKTTSILATVFSALTILSSSAMAQQYSPQGNYSQGNYYGYNQSNANNNSAGNVMQNWQNWFSNQFQNGQWQNGDGNIFQDAKGFYKLMGNGRTKWKFYFDVDFQAEMDAWVKGNANAKQNQNNQFNGYGQQNWNQNGYYQPGYQYQYNQQGYGQQYQGQQQYYPNYYYQ